MAYQQPFHRIQGVQYVRDQLEVDAKNLRDRSKIQTEYQFFPESYFSGSDVTLYFDDIWADDIISLEFSLNEHVLPIYGYNSYVYDAAPRGQRIVQGQFRIAFREAGYLSRLFDHIGQLQAKAMPKLAYELGGVTEDERTGSQWNGDWRMTLEQLIEDTYGGTPNSALTVKDPAVGWPDLKYRQTHAKVKELQQLILKGYKGLRAPTTWPPAGEPSFKGLKRGLTYNSANKAKMMLLHKRLNGILFEAGMIPKELYVGAPYDYTTENAVRIFQQFANIPTTGWIDDATYTHITHGVGVTGEYSIGTKIAIARFQWKNKVQGDEIGNLGNATKKALGLAIGIADPINRDPSLNGAAAKDYASYEAKIWGRDFDASNSRDFTTFFYGTDKQKWLKLDGFDIYVNYGPLPQAIMWDNDGNVPDKISFETTIKAIRKVQITGVSQVMGPDGNPIEEVYTFIARDMD